MGNGYSEHGKEPSGYIKYREYFLSTELPSLFSRKSSIRVVTILTEKLYRFKIG
jgi:hypothetical protein